VREKGQNGSAVIALLARRAALLALAIIAIAAAGVYQVSSSTNDLQSEYAMADNAIESNLGQ
jgi:transketolase C-terminal domain/subunit